MGGSYAQTALPLAVSEAEYNTDNQLSLPRMAGGRPFGYESIPS
jgi:hypothetical protein